MTGKELLDALTESGTGSSKIAAIRESVTPDCSAQDVISAARSLGFHGTVDKALIMLQPGMKDVWAGPKDPPIPLGKTAIELATPAIRPGMMSGTTADANLTPKKPEPPKVDDVPPGPQIDKPDNDVPKTPGPKHTKPGK